MLAYLSVIFGLSMIVALSGALVPGPLLTYTVIRTLETPKRGFLIGFFVILGHACVEMIIILSLLLGFSLVLRSEIVVMIIGTGGGLFLIYMGTDIMVKISRKRFALPLSTPANSDNTRSMVKIANPIVGGAVVSMSNPYWWVWWATIGFGFMLQYRISLLHWQALTSFFIGHETGDLLWYATVSTILSIGKRRINKKLYTIILALCSVVIIGFGIFLVIVSLIKSHHIG